MTRVLLLSAFVTAIVAVPHAAQDIAGKYGCIGSGPDGKTYEVDLSVEKRNDGYALTWTTEGQTSGIGVGLLKGDVLTAIFQTPNALGLVAYTVSKNGLDGTWTVPQLDGVLLPEKCSLGSGPAKAV
jgi:hypothetical protein